MTSGTPRQQLADIALGRPVADFIADRRDAGASYRTIARELHAATGGQVDVTDQTVRAWARTDVAA